MNVIQIENLWKEYRLGVIGHGTLTQDLQSWWARIRGKEDPNSMVSIFQGKGPQIEGDRFWALRDINFNIKQGDIVGVVGKNGAGKSTLLKILSRVTAPTKGMVKIKGRIASLLEVGTGFHPELTGKENIFMNGAILGMSKAEIVKKIDEIIDFSGVEDFIDTPVKRYSSGMRVRLAFSVAAHLDPEILVIDEVLAVGDSDFQKKCLGKMGQVAKQGRTVLFVSHNLVSVRELCKTGIVIEDGEIGFIGNVTESIDYYIGDIDSPCLLRRQWDNNLDEKSKVFLKSIEIENDTKSNKFYVDDNILLKYLLKINVEDKSIGSTIKIKNSKENVIFSTRYDLFLNKSSKAGMYEVRLIIPAKTLNSGFYSIDLVVGESNKYILLNIQNILKFEILFGRKLKYNKRLPGDIYKEIPWMFKKIQ